MEPVIAPEESIQIDSHLDGGQERSLADDALDGLTQAPSRSCRRSTSTTRAGRSCSTSICELAGVLPDARRALDPRSACATEIAQLDRRRGAGRARLGHGRQDARAARRDAGQPGLFAALRAGRRDRERWCANARRTLTAEYPGLRVHGDDRRLRAPSGPPARQRSARASWPSSAAPIGNFPPGSAPALPALASPGCSDRSDHLLMGTDLVKDPLVLAGRLRRRARG